MTQKSCDTSVSFDLETLDSNNYEAWWTSLTAKTCLLKMTLVFRILSMITMSSQTALTKSI